MIFRIRLIMASVAAITVKTLMRTPYLQGVIHVTGMPKCVVHKIIVWIMVSILQCFDFKIGKLQYNRFDLNLMLN